MFSENHLKILQEITLSFSDTQILADKIGLPMSLTKHFLDELSNYEFITAARAFRAGKHEVENAYLSTRGKAAVDSPKYFLGKSMNQQNGNNWYGDRVAGDKFTGDKVMGNKVQIGTVQGDAVAGNKIVNSQNLNQAAQDIKALLDQLTIDYPNDDTYTQAGRAIGTIQNNPTLKQRTVNAVKEFGKATVQQAIEAVTDNRAVKVLVAGIEGFIEAEG